MQTALEGLPGLLPGDVKVTGAAGGPWRVVFGGRYHGRDLPGFSADAAATITPVDDLSQAEDQILVYFNDDNLYGQPVTTGELPVNPTAVDPSFYQLILTQDTVRNTDDFVYRPNSITYDPVTDMAVLTFSGSLTGLLNPNTGAPVGPGTFRLRIGTNETIPLAPRTLAAWRIRRRISPPPSICPPPAHRCWTSGRRSRSSAAVPRRWTARSSRSPTRNDKVKVFEFNDPSVGSGTVSNASHRAVTFESGDSGAATTPAGLAAAVQAAIQAAITAGELSGLGRP